MVGEEKKEGRFEYEMQAKEKRQQSTDSVELMCIDCKEM